MKCIVRPGRIKLMVSIFLWAGIILSAGSAVAAAFAGSRHSADSAVACHGYDMPIENEYLSASDLKLLYAGLIGIGIFGMKTGVASGLANLAKGQVLIMAVLYSLAVAGVGFIFSGNLNFPAILGLVGTLPHFYAVLALTLLAAGIYTVKKWQTGKDVTRYSLGALIVPCPLLFISIMLTAGLLPGVLELSSRQTGILIGVGFFIGITVAWLAIYRKKSPLTLGKLMTAAGLGLLAAVLILPAYFAQGLNIAGNDHGLVLSKHLLVPVIFCITFILLGVIKGRLKWV